jgi:hypothetical protein
LGTLNAAAKENRSGLKVWHKPPPIHANGPATHTALFLEFPTVGDLVTNDWFLPANLTLSHGLAIIDR